MEMNALDDYFINTVNKLMEDVEHDYDPRHMLAFKKNRFITARRVLPLKRTPKHRPSDLNIEPVPDTYPAGYVPTIHEIIAKAVQTGKVTSDHIAKNVARIKKDEYLEGTANEAHFWQIERDTLRDTEDSVRILEKNNKKLAIQLDLADEFVKDNMPEQHFKFQAVVLPTPKKAKKPQDKPFSVAARGTDTYEHSVDYLMRNGMKTEYQAIKFIKMAEANGLDPVDLDYIRRHKASKHSRLDHVLGTLRYALLKPKSLESLPAEDVPLTDDGLGDLFDSPPF